MSGAIQTQGTVIKRGNGGSPEVFTAIDEVVDFDGPGGKGNLIDVTHLGSVAKEKLVGLMDEGNFSMTLNYVPSSSTQQLLRADRTARVIRNFQVVFTDAGHETGSFSAYVTNYVLSGKPDDKVVLKLDLEITGAVTWS
jgi:predicted secreted protein